LYFEATMAKWRFADFVLVRLIFVSTGG